MSNHMEAILWKQIKDTVKNKTILIQFLMFPLMTVVMEKAVSIPDMPKHFFCNLFSVMYVGMAPLTSAAAIISEEREKNTLRVMQMFNVKAAAFLIGNAVYIISLCMLGSLVIGAAGGYRGRELLIFMLLMLLGHSCSFLLGAAIGALSRSQMAATSVTVPVMMVLSFLPMLSLFNETVGKLSKYLYSEQLYLLINTISEIRLTAETGIIVACNILLITGAFLAVYRKMKQD